MTRAFLLPLLAVTLGMAAQPAMDLRKDRIAVLECSYMQGGGGDAGILNQGVRDTVNRQGVKEGLNEGIYRALLRYADSASIIGADSLRSYLEANRLYSRFYTAFIPLQRKTGLFRTGKLHQLELEDERLGERLSKDLKVRYLFIPVSHYKERSESSTPLSGPGAPTTPIGMGVSGGIGLTLTSGNLLLDFEIYDLETFTIVTGDQVKASATIWFGTDYQAATERLGAKLAALLEDDVVH